MLPTLSGRIQTRLFLLATVGLVVTALIVPVLPGAGSAALGDRYRTGLVVLASVAVLGVCWELLYHFLMQFRWEKDWPTLFGLLTLVPEGLLLWGLLELDVVPGITAGPPAATFWIHFAVVWLAVWLVANGPMRVPFVRWRFRGGRLV
ncbi:hypothetical protein SAMN04489712_12024 [Thermomonospora echinospora]|uniref:Uncharacterized protein n=1 Tax=Thermomonospora echinospora TaxID=1992 RepID=A0A1H6DNT8_9ACTN|nr:hypothetical protein [Thermomonospora echinospora]SEG86874.1 hypothetical protein SAMN04489712_12024 [Thermomonospora echinospora]